MTLRHFGLLICIHVSVAACVFVLSSSPAPVNFVEELFSSSRRYGFSVGVLKLHRHLVRR